MNKIAAILLLAAVAVQAKYIPEIQDGIVRYPHLIKLMNANVDATSRDAKIIGGTPAKQGEFPYQCHMSFKEQGSIGSFFCGCSVLSENWILTAAHCAVNVTNVEITLGDTVQSTVEGTEQKITALDQDVIPHENYKAGLITNDVAVIKLSRPAVLGTAVQPICLAPTNIPDDKYDGQTARVSGWGKTSDAGGVSNQLNYVDVAVQNYTTCNSAFPLAYSRTNICTSTAGDRGTCNGDSGGPLVIFDPDIKKTIQIGIVSFGSGRGCTSEPSVFTRVSSFREWVGNKTRDDATIC